MYLVGGSGTKTSDPDIALELFSWSSPCLSGAEGEKLHEPSSGTFDNSNAAEDKPVASAPASPATITSLGSSTPGAVSAPTLVRVTASQEGEVPTARIGHAAVTLTQPPSSPPASSSRPSSIFLFGGEAPIASNCADEGSRSPGYPKLGDIYEGTPKGPSGTLVWRSLTSSLTQTPQNSTATEAIGASGNGGNVTTAPDIVIDVPAPMAFHAFCAALVRGSSGGSSGDGNSDANVEQALLVHGGINQNLELLEDLWAFFPSRLSKLASGGQSGVVRGGDATSVDSNGGGVRATGWERLLPQGNG